MGEVHSSRKEVLVVATCSHHSTMTGAEINHSIRVKLRQKKGSGRSRKDRHVSCVDLGPGQYEGWLEKKTDTRFGTKWSRVWCVLKDFVFYYYKSKKDLKAKGMICLVGYEVTSEEGKKPKYVFICSFNFYPPSSHPHPIRS
ncbi:connector enhancer of kinase suppressor of ras 2-like [Anneissia japonica]|uniref:connector enhancer of kinase suppressor of ras 2-like n=1 Tax=Anneissia japonica TaxID=1529436 RepID=UPI0014255187|nr:connector enhancer of kinase suppressor of ras 2-like [Anneissia japonica]